MLMCCNIKYSLIVGKDRYYFSLLLTILYLQRHPRMCKNIPELVHKNIISKSNGLNWLIMYHFY